MSLKIEREDYIKAALALYQETNSEITRYRDYEWKLPTWTVALLVFIISGAIQIDKLELDSGKTYILKTILASFAVVATAFSCWYIYSLHERLIENRRIRRTLSNLFGFTEKGKYVDNESLLPEKYKSEMPKFINGIVHVIASYIFLILSVIYTLVLMFVR